MQPIGPVGQDPIASVTEAMLRYGNNQELKGAQEREVAGDLREDVAFEGDVVELAETPPSQPSQPSQAQGKSSAPQAQGTPPGKDGQEEARQQALSQHSAEQHGRQELRWMGERHTQRSTREIIHRVEGSHGEQHLETSHGKGGGHAAGGSHAPGHASGGGHAAGGARQHGVSAGMPHLGAEVVAAAVNSGLFSTADLAEDEEQGFEFDENAEHADSSQEATEARLSQQGKKLAERGGMQSSLGFDRDKDDDRREFTPGRQSFQQGRQDGERREGPQAPAAERRGDAARVGEEAAAEVVADGFAGATATVPGAAAAALGDVASAPGAAEAGSGAGAQGTGAGAGGTVESAQDTVEHPIVLSPGVDLLTDDEYFFFDDARFAPDAA